MADADLWQRRDQALGAGAEYFYDTPLEIVRGEGAYLFDSNGRRYVDLYNNVPCVGHGNPVVVRAMAQQQATLNVHNRYLHEGIVNFAERLTSLHHEGIESVVFSCSGTEANEVALSMARHVTGQRGIVCTGSAYHGSAGVVDSLTYVGDEPRGMSEICGFPYPDCYRPLADGLSDAVLAEQYLATVARAIAHLKNSGAGFAGLIVCPIFANEGLPRVPAGLLGNIAALVRREGGLLIADEVQSGYGRTGRWWAYESEAITPDIVVMGKPMGNGLPMAATASSREFVERFRKATGYFNTFASSPLQGAVGMAVLDEIERMGLIVQAQRVGSALLGELQARCAAYPWVGDVRGRGLFISVELVKDKLSKEPAVTLANRLANDLMNQGCLLSFAGSHNNVVKIRPPLVFAEPQAEEFLKAFDYCAAQLSV